MKTIIAGSRSINNYNLLLTAIRECPWQITEVVSGGAFGVDLLGEQYARDKEIPYCVFPARWKALGRAAGYLRNKVMSENAQALLALWDGQSKGTKHMIDIAQRTGLKVFVYTAP